MRKLRRIAIHWARLRIKPMQRMRNGQRSLATMPSNQKVNFNNDVCKPFEEIPSMTMLPLIGTAWMLLPVIGRYDITRLAEIMFEKHKTLGDIYREKFGPVNMVISSSPDDMKTLLQAEGPYPYRTGAETMKVYRESRKQWYKTQGLLILQGEEWWHLRSKTQRHLMKPKAIQAFLNPMQDIARDLVDKMQKVMDSNNEVPDFLGELYKWALESVAMVGLDIRLGCLKTDLHPDSDALRMIRSVHTQFECMNKLESFMGNLTLWKIFPTPLWKKFAKAADDFSEIAFKHINRALETIQTSADHKDLTLLQSMLMTKDLDVSEALVTMSDMLMAGIDTTSNSVNFFLYHIAKNPDKQEILYQEIKRLLPKKEDRITPSLFNEMKYLKACIKESQRLNPVAGGTSRTVDQDIVLSGYRVPAKTLIVIMMQVIYKDARYFSNPEKFLPERWFRKDDKYHSYAFLPFGFGTRSCIGRRLAELEIICALTEIIRNFRIEYHYGDFGIITKFINTADKPLKFTFIKR